MEMERINDHTIRIMVENEDLEDRGTSVKDLLSDRTKIESFFYNILSEIDVDNDFMDNDKVSFQILPNKNGLELFISRMDSENGISDILDTIVGGNELRNDTKDEIDNLSDERRSALMGQDSFGNHENSDNKVRPVLVYRFSEVEDLIKLAVLMKNVKLINTLFSYQGELYLTVDFSSLECSEDQYNFMLGSFYEFAELSKFSYDALVEHGQVVYFRSALKQIAKLFS
ncbi:adaptor protein MecA [Convivina praedatoris]|uniref:Adapter protein MecA 1 n=1 Tax=Convivina praedatoris TaxID=2880963 RepID=A0ABN8HD85_9LACO|nr:adaptor protein MecA [Convivina sp. LMG 32447]CAH1854006.1 Adapter protein MecA 1 [Convivina sp. LMG 32447]CAH1855300.1 Adapter protein MecA 1 [Convivina sp. LMG 32447]CAH1855371.1 Adapter protein MecA 1 [Convivina sp. LMG 32447]